MLKQDLHLKQLYKLSPQQIQLMKLVQLPTLAFEQKVYNELEENPALEGILDIDEDEEYTDYSEDYNDDYYDDRGETESQRDQAVIDIERYLDDDIPNYRVQSNNYSEDNDYREVSFAEHETYQEHLKNQIHTLRITQEERQIIDFIIGNLDDDGYLRRDLLSVSDDLAFNQAIYTYKEKIEELLINYVQKLDPIGTGATNLRECLLIQLKAKKKNKSIDIALDIIYNMFDAFTKKHYSKIIQKLSITEEELKEAINEILKLNPKPGKIFSDNSKNIEEVIPDFTIRIDGKELELSLNGRNVPDLKISKEYQQILETYKDSDNKSTKDQKETVLFVKQKLDSARWFIDAVKERQNTLVVTMTAIMEFQREYLLTGDESKIKPMILKNISDITGMDISTISRVANSKYVNTPYGTILIKGLFSESLTNEEGEEVSTRGIKTILKEIINEEDSKNPLTDDNLNKILKEKGYNIARRTIAKYREQLNIPVARLRKKI